MLTVGVNIVLGGKDITGVINVFWVEVNVKIVVFMVADVVVLSVVVVIVVDPGWKFGSWNIIKMDKWK